MKTKLLTAVCVLAITAWSTNVSSASEWMESSASESYSGDKTADAIADVLIARPLCFAATIVGSALFLVSLPVAATSKSVNKSADILVGRPARATFTRPIGNFNKLPD